MRILYVLPKQQYFLQGPGGRVTHAVGVVSGLVNNGQQVHVCSGPGLDKFMSGLGPKVHLEEIPVIGKGRWREYLWNSEMMKFLNAFLRSESTIRVVIIRYGTSNGFAFLPLLRRYPDRIWIFEVNSLFAHQEQASKLPSQIRSLIFNFERQIVSAADFVYVVASGLKDQLTSKAGLVGPIREEKVLVVPNAGKAELADIRRRRHRPKKGCSRGRKFAYLGVFQNYYEFDVVAKAFQQVQRKWDDAELHLFGYGGNESAVRLLFREVPKVFFHGKFDLQTLVQSGTFDENWILLLPYSNRPIAHVGSPTKMFEYMALGLPIIAARVGQVPEILEEDAFAFLYQPGSAESLANVMYSACQSTHLPEMGYVAQQTFMEKHTWEKRMATFLTEVQNRASCRST